MVRETATVAVLTFISALGLTLWLQKRKRKQCKKRMKLYYFPFFRSSRCTWLIEELGIQDDVEFIYLDPKDPDRQKIQLYKDEKHIHGTVPFLDIENEMPILESGAVCLYLADLHGKFVPQPETRKDYYNWVLYACSTLDEVLETLYIQWGETTPENQDKELISKAIDKFSLFANYFSKFLEGKTYICGNRFTAADCVIGYNIWWSSVMKEDNLIQNYPNIVKYLDTLKKRPAFQKVFQC